MNRGVLAGLLLSLFCTGCGTFQLAKSVKPPTGKTPDQVRLDTLDCKDRARTYAESGDKQARAFVLGLTIVGAPLAYAAERADQRFTFKACMETQGYTVVPVTN